MTGKKIYPHRPDLYKKYFYKCDNCGGYVGCHGYTKKPLGTPANAKLRKARGSVHAIIDPLWKAQKSRKDARAVLYKFLAFKMGIPQSEAHVGMFDIKRCRLACEIMRPITFDDILNEFTEDIETVS